jgi:ABC-type lipoprotein export system ATPase subunit/ABC-type antimicrobial peptide transport system permease subunit
MIEVEHLSFHYPSSSEQTLKDISVVFPSSGLFYLTGESGSGKTTFLSLLSGLLSNYDGSIRIDGKELKDMGRKEKEELLRSRISFCQQSDLYASEMNVREAIKMSMDISDYSSEEKENRLKKISKELSLEGLLLTKSKNLSGGEIKRVCLARSLVRDSSYLFLDEPLGPLDKKLRQRITSLFERISRNRLVLIISHSNDVIKPSDNVIEFKDGQIEKKSKGKAETEREKSKAGPELKRKPYSFWTSLSSALVTLKSRLKRTLSSLFSCTLALTSLGLITLISSGISSGLKSYLSGDSNEDDMCVEMRQNELMAPSEEASSFSKAEEAMKKYPLYIYSIGSYFNIDFENLFLNENRVFFLMGSQSLNLLSLSGRNFAEAAYYKDLGGEYDYLGKMKLNDNQLILSLVPNDLTSLDSFLSLKGKDPETEINLYLQNHLLPLHLNLRADSFGYSLEEMYEVKKVVMGKKSRIVHTSPSFAESFVLDSMHFQTVSSSLGPFKNPWTVYSSYFVSVYPSLKREFLEKKDEDENFNYVSFVQLKERQPTFFSREEPFSQGRMELINNDLKTVAYSDISKICLRYSQFLDSLLFSDNFYYCSSEGMVSGFLKPVYVSDDREKLNEVADFNYEAQFNLEGFQGSTITFKDGVVMGDLSGTDKNPLIFKPYLSPPSLLKGTLPYSSKEVLISSSLCASLFKDYSSALNQTLYLTCLKETVYKDGGYKNIFADGEVIIRGIVEDEKFCLIQKPTFLKALSEDQFDIESSQLLNTRVILKFKKGGNVELFKESLEKEYPQYRFSLPGKEMAESIDKIISYIDSGLMVFAFFSGLIAAFLMVFVIVLFIQEGQERIKAMRGMGYAYSDIENYYLSACLLIGLFSYLSSSFTLSFISLFLSSSLEAMLGMELTLFIPKMFSRTFVFAVFLIFFSSVCCHFRLRAEVKKLQR